MTNEEQIIKDSFNIGYVMQLHEPELLEKLLKGADQNNATINAMIMGKQQVEIEKVIKQQQQIKNRQQLKKRGR